jgi:4-alpha-glucanotransferase
MHVHFYLRFATRFGQQIFLKPQTGEPILMTYVNDEFWRCSMEVAKDFSYTYFLREQGKMDDEMFGKLSLAAQYSAKQTTIIDTWNGTENLENTFYTQAFEKLLRTKRQEVKVAEVKQPTHLFSIKVPVLQENEVPVLVGSGNSLHDWSTYQPVMMQPNGDFWTAAIKMDAQEFPISYKYAIYNLVSGQVSRFEDGINRTLYFSGNTGEICDVRDGFIRLPVPRWRGSGVAIPVFSLRTADSFGCGAFSDLKPLADWAASVGMKVIQLLPINDTAATGTFTDSYPYASISAYALNPIYVNPKAIAGKKHADLVKTGYAVFQKELALLEGVDYEVTLREKWTMLTALYHVMSADMFKSSDFKAWFEAQKHWLEPYAAFCYLKDLNKTTDFNQWKTNSTYQSAEIKKLTDSKAKTHSDIALHYFVQYHLHLQLKDATDYANSKGLIMKGDIPIGIYRYSVDAWVEPELYNMNMQAGAPPDDFAAAGQNWGFPTYRWDRMMQDGLAWWASRFNQMSLYFDAFRIDHILGFFRIWSIPLDAVQGILGRFEPAIPVQIGELLESGMAFNHERLTRPFINTSIINALFGIEAIQALAIFMNADSNGGYHIKERYNTQRKVEQWFEESERSKTAELLRDGMYNLIANVILFETNSQYGPAYHFRYGIEQTHSFKYLDQHTQHQLRRLYNNYFFQRQDAFWEREAMEKLPALKRATSMLICGEDLGMVPACVPDVMEKLAMLSLEIQRMPKAIGVAFADPRQAPYLSVVTPSTHDMSTIRGWWEEDRGVTERFYRDSFHTEAHAPAFCEPWINRSVIEQHLASPAMWSIFQLQDLMGMDGELRYSNPQAERINEPANPRHYWRYRMHLDLEQLLKETKFNTLLTELIRGYGR